MLDFGAGEFVVVGVVALIAIGPKELPSVLRAIGRSVGKMRRMAGDFQNQFNDAMREMELEEARKKMEEMSKSVSDSVQAATHIDLPNMDLNTPAVQSNAGETSGSDQSQTTPTPEVHQASSVLGVLPDIHAPSSESLLAQAQTEAQSIASHTPDPVDATPAQTTPEQPPKSPTPHGTGSAV